MKTLRNLEARNLREIENLSQRGQTLSIIDLIRDNTLNTEMAAFLFYAMSHKVSFLTAARPGNAGKTTLMACMLMYLPPDLEIITVDREVISSTLKEDNDTTHTCFLCHEIGSGPWYGYLWGSDIGRYFKFIGENRSIASCIHADTLDDMREVLISDELSVTEEDFNRLDLILFMHLDKQGREYRRRISALCEVTGLSSSESHRPLYIWNPRDDAFIKQGSSFLLQRLAKKTGKTEEQIEQELRDCESAIEGLMLQNITDFRDVRRAIARFYERYRTL